MKTINFKWPIGFQSGATHAGFKDHQKQDLCWMVSKVPAVAAGVYTTNQFQAAPVQFTKHTIDKHHQMQAWIINSGNANSFTGKQGIQNVQIETQLVSKKLHLNPNLIGVASTGIIGKQMQMDLFENGLNQLQLSDQNYDATKAILTTDTSAKKICIELNIDNHPVTITGFAKGSGMIHPHMGTTLSFITTDAHVDKLVLQKILQQKIATSFNQITVDGCMSTNDMVLSMANGMADNPIIKEHTKEFKALAKGYELILTSLAKMVAKDGEGANKLVEVHVHNAYSQLEANQVARAIVGSNLVKAMIFGEENNWGRIVQAIGQTIAHVDPNAIGITFGGVPLVKDSTPLKFDEQKIKRILAGDEIKIEVDLNSGHFHGIAWGCDLSYKYVEINAAYEG
ncbi:arginine biosynthesis bifunctional protein ArgJ [Philodulcilactobacillus myokoensis]|uniref:Arginine biosynthesis bifunctional protein ArgJ n=1 Tax=Philodulcilactobacillus myokoensis TaxID=2929573 RepID=A0A9W6EUA5_9LACO|nr:bifunctional glutamate N-acetyltransferase/amino-acid acetyltransferase ArgJ [Philodulcilactobacillus myokoensis]GLB47424.1 arginine biosynthesis bifunctional protein ArgJ [Philodulcilactobacillus myokoensis]